MSAVVKDAFKDYKYQGNLLDSNVANINLFKKSKKVEIDLESDKQIETEEISIFEDYLKDKFEVGEVKINIRYSAYYHLKELQKNECQKLIEEIDNAGVHDCARVQS